ncbi:MAG: hypothetical protein DMG59_22985 [Acidobacteria bacterium]|nr:MAG: hypothetical protein DMG59_22985 [Acidobacteriota bacterium]
MRNYSALLVLVLMAALTVPAVAQQRSSAGIYGSVSDSQGAVIPGAKVTVLHVSTNQARTTVTNQTGEYLFPLLPVGEYRISVERPGWSCRSTTTRKWTLCWRSAKRRRPSQWKAPWSVSKPRMRLLKKLSTPAEWWIFP